MGQRAGCSCVEFNIFESAAVWWDNVAALASDNVAVASAKLDLGSGPHVNNFTLEMI